MASRRFPRHDATPGSAPDRCLLRAFAEDITRSFLNSSDNVAKGIPAHTKGPSNITVLMAVMKMDGLFSFWDFGGSGKGGGALEPPDCLFTFALFK